jgi:hypothetical protein
MSHRLLLVRGSAKPADTVACSLRFWWFTVSARASASLPSRIRFVFWSAARVRAGDRARAGASLHAGVRDTHLDACATSPTALCIAYLAIRKFL